MKTSNGSQDIRVESKCLCLTSHLKANRSGYRAHVIAIMSITSMIVALSLISLNVYRNSDNICDNQTAGLIAFVTFLVTLWLPKGDLFK